MNLVRFYIWKATAKPCPGQATKTRAARAQVGAVKSACRHGPGPDSSARTSRPETEDPSYLKEKVKCEDAEEPRWLHTQPGGPLSWIL